MNRTHQLELDLHDHPDALRRVITVCRRRDCRILALSYREGRLQLEVAGEPDQAARLRAWLANLVEVLAVRRAG